MHRATIAVLLAIAIAPGLACPGAVRAAAESGDSYVSSIEAATVVVIGTALNAGAGRVVNGCQYTAATVRVEEVLLGELPSPAPADLTVEFVGDCVTVGGLGDAVPRERAIWFLINKGTWLREFVVPRTGDWGAEDAYWRPLRPDAIAVDHAGALEQYGAGANWLPRGTFAAFVSELRDSAYMRPDHQPQAPVGLGIWFAAQAYLTAAAAILIALLAGLWALIRRGRGRRFAALGAALALAGACIAMVGGPRLARTVDFAGGIHGRTAVVEALHVGSLTPAENDDYTLPAGLESLAREGVVQATPGPPATVFFLTQVFFSPDPYCGYEYAQVPEALVLDPLGSGGGGAEDLGEGWYWVCAS